MLTASDIARAGVVGSSTAERRKRAEFLAWALGDFQRFVGLLKILPKDGVKRRFVLNDIQRRYCATRTQRDAVLKPRQIGFTTLEQARDIYTLITKPGARVVTMCQSADDNSPSLLLSANYELMLTSLREAGLALSFRSESATKWVLAERDSSLRIIPAGASEAAAKKKGRAGTVTRLHLTETAFYDYAEDTLNALLEAVPGEEHGSEVVNESTANGVGGWFHQNCKGAEAGRNGYKLHFYPWFEATEYSIPLDPGESIVARNEREALLLGKGVTPAQLKWYRRKVTENGQDKVDQEYPSDPETCFLVSGRGFFNQRVTSALIEKATREPIEQRDRYRISIWKRPEPEAKYVIAADPSEGGGGDPSGVLVYNWTTGEHVATVLGQYAPYELAKVLAELGTEYNNATIAVERNNHGHAVIQALQREHRYKKLYEHEDEKLGWPTNAVTRPVMLDLLEDAHRRGLWTTPDRNVLGQIRAFIVTDNGKAEAAAGEHDDLVLAAAIGWAVRQRKPASYGMA